MPINKRYPIEELISACEKFIEERKKMITLEYILIKGVNDDLGQALLLAKHAKRLNAKVNLIPYNNVDGLEWERPDLSHINSFHKLVEKENAPRVTLRMEKGHDIAAACGQLRLKERKSKNLSMFAGQTD
jgi:23S rRNA (adenine2503-C2)-methyltransferase